MRLLVIAQVPELTERQVLDPAQDLGLREAVIIADRELGRILEVLFRARIFRHLRRHSSIHGGPPVMTDEQAAGRNEGVARSGCGAPYPEPGAG